MSGYKEWADEEVLEAADVNTYLASQSIPRFADATARDAALGSPEDGQLCHTADAGLWIFYSPDWQRLVPVPAGGTTGQVLAKVSGTDFDLAWVTP
jgi:hypothetical protein